MSARFRWLFVAALFVTGCGSKATAVVVTITAEHGVLADSARVHLVVLGGAGRVTAPTASRFDRLLTPGDADPPYPFTLTLSPLDGDIGRSYNVTATAESATGTFVGQVRAIGGYVEGETQTIRLTLEDRCRAIVCSAEQTCEAGVCADARVGGLVDAGARDPSPVNFPPRNLPVDIWGSAVGVFSVAGTATINTDSGAVVVDGVASRAFAPVDVAAVGDCHAIFALVTREFRVAAGATVSVTGSRGLAIVSTGPVVLDGRLDVGAHGVTAGPGGLVRVYGGGYGSEGALAGCQSGGTIPTFGNPELTGLCGGSTVDHGGGAGGALQVASMTTVSIGSTGVIRAVGGGGGAIGGSGGGVLVQAPQVTIAGVISVNGGGGSSPLSIGADGGLAEAGAGGLGGPLVGTDYAGNGGAGAWQNGGAHPGGAGGYTYNGTFYCDAPAAGGGGAGRIRIEATVRDYRSGRVLEYPGLAGVFTDGPLP